MTGSVIEIAVSAIILVGVIWAIWKGGAANPVGTGEVLAKVGLLTGRMAKVEESIVNTVSKGEVAVLASEIRELEQRTASSGEMHLIQRQIEQLRAEVAGSAKTADVAELRAELRGIAKAADRTEEGVSRIEGYFLQRGVNGQ